NIIPVRCPVIIAQQRQFLALFGEFRAQLGSVMSARALRDVADIGVDLLLDEVAGIDHARNFGTPGVIILLRDRMGLETGDELLRVIVLAAGHPAGGLDTTAKHIVVGILFVVRPGIVAEYSIDLQRANEKDETADQLVARNVAHAMVVVLKAEVP